MDQNLYNFLFKKGNEAQEIFVEFMEKELGHIFLAGDRNGETVNVDMIEEIARCSFIKPNTFGRHGPRLLFSNGNKHGYTMPDELFLLNSGDYSYRFYDVKKRNENNLSEKYGKINDYANIEYFSKIKTYVAVTIWNTKEKGFDIYVRSATEIRDENYGIGDYDDVYFDLDMFAKINRKAIKP
jgi:hypothetical protein